MAEYRLLIKLSTTKEIEAIGTERERRRIVERVGGQGKDARPPGCEKLASGFGLFRVRQGACRIVYAIDDARCCVEVVKLGHRREVCRRIP